MSDIVSAPATSNKARVILWSVVGVVLAVGIGLGVYFIWFTGTEPTVVLKDDSKREALDQSMVNLFYMPAAANAQGAPMSDANRWQTLIQFQIYIGFHHKTPLENLVWDITFRRFGADSDDTEISTIAANTTILSHTIDLTNMTSKSGDRMNLTGDTLANNSDIYVQFKDYKDGGYILLPSTISSTPLVSFRSILVPEDMWVVRTLSGITAAKELNLTFAPNSFFSQLTQSVLDKAYGSNTLSFEIHAKQVSENDDNTPEITDALVTKLTSTTLKYTNGKVTWPISQSVTAYPEVFATARKRVYDIYLTTKGLPYVLETSTYITSEFVYYRRLEIDLTIPSIRSITQYTTYPVIYADKLTEVYSPPPPAPAPVVVSASASAAPVATFSVVNKVTMKDMSNSEIVPAVDKEFVVQSSENKTFQMVFSVSNTNNTKWPKDLRKDLFLTLKSGEIPEAGWTSGFQSIDEANSTVTYQMTFPPNRTDNPISRNYIFFYRFNNEDQPAVSFTVTNKPVDMTFPSKPIKMYDTDGKELDALLHVYGNNAWGYVSEKPFTVKVRVAVAGGTSAQLTRDAFELQEIVSNNTISSLPQFSFSITAVDVQLGEVECTLNFNVPSDTSTTTNIVDRQFQIVHTASLNDTVVHTVSEPFFISWHRWENNAHDQFAASELKGELIDGKENSYNDARIYPGMTLRFVLTYITSNSFSYIRTNTKCLVNDVEIDSVEINSVEAVHDTKFQYSILIAETTTPVGLGKESYSITAKVYVPKKSTDLLFKKVNISFKILDIAPATVHTFTYQPYTVMNSGNSNQVTLTSFSASNPLPVSDKGYKGFSKLTSKYDIRAYMTYYKADGTTIVANTEPLDMATHNETYNTHFKFTYSQLARFYQDDRALTTGVDKPGLPIQLKLLLVNSGTVPDDPKQSTHVLGTISNYKVFMGFMRTEWTSKIRAYVPFVTPNGGDLPVCHAMKWCVHTETKKMVWRAENFVDYAHANEPPWNWNNRTNFSGYAKQDWETTVEESSTHRHKSRRIFKKETGKNDQGFPYEDDVDFKPIIISITNEDPAEKITEGGTLDIYPYRVHCKLQAIATEALTGNSKWFLAYSEEKLPNNEPTKYFYVTNTTEEEAQTFQFNMWRKVVNQKRYKHDVFYVKQDETWEHTAFYPVSFFDAEHKLFFRKCGAARYAKHMHGVLYTHNDLKDTILPTRRTSRLIQDMTFSEYNEDIRLSENNIITGANTDIHTDKGWHTQPVMCFEGLENAVRTLIQTVSIDANSPVKTLPEYTNISNVLIFNHNTAYRTARDFINPGAYWETFGIWNYNHGANPWPGGVCLTTNLNWPQTWQANKTSPLFYPSYDHLRPYRGPLINLPDRVFYWIRHHTPNSTPRFLSIHFSVEKWVPGTLVRVAFRRWDGLLRFLPIRPVNFPNGNYYDKNKRIPWSDAVPLLKEDTDNNNYPTTSTVGPPVGATEPDLSEPKFFLPTKTGDDRTKYHGSITGWWEIEVDGRQIDAMRNTYFWQTDPIMEVNLYFMAPKGSYPMGQSSQSNGEGIHQAVGHNYLRQDSTYTQSGQVNSLCVSVL